MIKTIKNNKGFTLVELIVVMAVIAIISAIAVPKFLKVQDRAKEDADYATGAMIAKAAELYKAKEKSSTDTDAAELVSSGYMNEIEFKSDKLSKYTAKDVQITFLDGVTTVKIHPSEGEDITLYPIK